MKTILNAFLLLFLFAAAAAAQTPTLVTGTITDLSGLAYSNARVTAQLIPSTASPTIIANGIPTQIGGLNAASADVNGNFTMNLFCNSAGGGCSVISPAGTQWQFTATIIGQLPPLGTGPQACTVTATITGASQSLTPLFNSCPALSAGNLNSLNTTGVTLSQTCGKAIAPCIQIPAGGGCFLGAITSNLNGIVTFQSGFPSPTPVVGQIAWVMTEHGNAFACGTDFNPAVVVGTYAETNYCGSPGGAQVTITAVNPGTSVTLSAASCVNQNGTNSYLFYAPNIFSQLRTACAAGLGAPLIATGFYALDNTGNGTSPACGDLGIGGPGVQGQPGGGTVLRTPPWYNHGGDLGTVIQGGLQNITLDGTWTPLNVGIGRGTPIYGSVCGSHDFNVRGYNFGNTATSETFYPASFNGLALAGNCEFHNGYIATGNSAIAGIGSGAAARMLVSNSTILAQAACFLSYGGPGNNATLTILGGFYQSAGVVQSGNGGCFSFPANAQTSSGDQIYISDAEVCMTGNSAAINDLETAGEVRLVNTKVNASPACLPGTNATAVALASGVTLRAAQTAFVANGTGKTITNPAGATFVDNCGNTFSGGAGYSGGGSLFGSCSITGTLQTAGNFADGAGLGTSTFGTITGDSRHGQVTVTYAGALTTTPQFTMTFPTTFLVAPSCTLQDVGGNNAFPTSIANGAISTTSVVFNLTFAVAPTVGNTDVFVWNCSN